MQTSEGSAGAGSAARESAGQVGFLTQVALLLWKNLLQQKRSVKVTVAEIIIPLLGAVIMLVIRQVTTIITLCVCECACVRVCERACVCVRTNV